jgi:CO/xanthine dehydrogenase Mo-binding subunit
MAYVGQSIPRLDAVGKVTGATQYPGDINLPDQVYMKVLFAHRPHAVVEQIDLSEAEKLPGVLAILTAKDVPNNEYGLIMPDQPVLCGPGSNKPFGDRVRFVGDQVAVIVAESEDIATQARDLIRVSFRDLPLVTEPRAAMQNASVLLHPDRDSNVFGRYRIRKGDVDNAFLMADVVIEGTYQTPVQEHAFLQPEAGIAYFDKEERITVQVAGQWTHEDQEQIAHALGLPLERIRVIYPAIGGAFGGREDMSVQIILALAVMKLSQKGIRRPIKIIWSREESIIGHHKRHPYFIKTRWGATKAGKVIAAEVELISDGGAYAYTSTKVLGNATLMCTGPYEIENVKVDAYAVYTNNIPNGAFRGFGGPQGAFAAEIQMDKLANALGIDPVELRMRNLLGEGSLLSVGSPLPKGVSIDQVTRKCAEAMGWENTPLGWARKGLQAGKAASNKRGVGIACAFKNVGFSYGAPEQSWATVELRGAGDIDEAIVYHAGADCGQGAHTAFAQFAAETLDLPLEKIRLVVSDTADTLTSGSASASRMTFMAGNAIKGACEEALERWKAEERPAKATFQYRPPRTTPLDPETGKSEPNFAYGYVAEGVEVEVNTETGQVQILKVVCADDVGKAVNPVQVQGQIEGAVVQAAGYAVLENFVQKDAIPLTRTLSTYLIPTVLDIPVEVQSIIIEYPDPIGPYGARGMGEMPYLALVPAICQAIHDATGIWINEFPFTPERVLDALAGQP